MTWVPFGADPEMHAVLVDGTPEWMVSSLKEWFGTEFTSTTGGRIKHRTPRTGRLRRLELESRIRVLAGMAKSQGVSGIFNEMSESERLRALDWTVRANARGYQDRNDDLERILRDGGSKWKVGVRNGVAGLEERVPAGVQDAADAAMGHPGDAGRLLSDAWRATYGMNPQPDLGYRKAIEAVEAAVLPIVMPNDSTATLGKAIGQMRTDGDWKLPFIKEHTQNPSQTVVLGMMQALWTGHSDRHPGTSNYIPSTQEAAEAAVSLAVTLVNLFSNGGIQQRV